MENNGTKTKWKREKKEETLTEIKVRIYVCQINETKPGNLRERKKEEKIKNII